MSGIENPTPATTFANPTASVGIAAVNGSAATAMRSDAAPALDQTAAYAFTGLGRTQLKTGSTFELFKTADQTTNFESIVESWVGNNATILTNNGGTGTLRNLQIGAGTTGGLVQLGANNTVSFIAQGVATLFQMTTTTITEFVNHVWSADNTYNLGASGAGRPANVFVATSVQVGLSPAILTGPAAATLQLGAANAASPVAQTLQVQSPRGGTDTDTAGADYTFNASQSTGTAAGGNIVEQTTFSAKSTSNAANTLVKRRIVNAKGKVLTSGAAASLVDITLPTLAMAGGCIRATVVCTNGTDMQSYSQVVTFASVNKGGVFTSTITADAGNDSKAVSAGTLTTAWALTAGTNKVTIQLTATTSLTPSTNAFLVYYQIENNSEQAITIL